MGYLYGDVRKCFKCKEFNAEIYDQKRYYCADCYSLKIWHKKLENVEKYLDKKEYEISKQEI